MECGEFTELLDFNQWHLSDCVSYFTVFGIDTILSKNIIGMVLEGSLIQIQPNNIIRCIHSYFLPW